MPASGLNSDHEKLAAAHLVPLRLHAALVSITMAVASMAYGQNFPSKPTRIVTGSPGGGQDFVARIIAQGLTGNLSQPAIVDNRATLIGIETVAKAAPDGYTLLLATNVTWTLPLMKKVSYDALKDLAPVTLAVSQFSILVVQPTLPVKSVKDLIALAKARPGQLNYAATGVGGTSHLTTELFKSMAGVDIAHIAYKGIAQSVNALMGGEVQLMFSTMPSAMPHVKSGRLRALAITTARPSALAPGFPTVASAGVPGYESVGMIGLFAPAKTPAALIQRLHQEVVRLLDTSDAKDQLSGSGIEVVASSPQEFATKIRSEIARMDKVIKSLDIRVE